MIQILLLISTLSIPTITWAQFFDRVTAQGITYTEELNALEGKRVRIRGYAVAHPRPAGKLFLTRFEHNDPHGVEEHDLPFDAVVAVWRKGIEVPPIPLRPTVEGTLRLGNNRLGADQVVTVTLEDATPVVPKE